MLPYLVDDCSGLPCENCDAARARTSKTRNPKPKCSSKLLWLFFSDRTGVALRAVVAEDPKRDRYDDDAAIIEKTTTMGPDRGIY